MGLILILSGLGFVALPGLARPLGRRLTPRLWAYFCIAGLSIGVLVFEFGLLLYAAPTVLRALGIPGLAATCRRMLGLLVPGGTLSGLAALSLGLTVMGLAAYGWAESLRIRRLARVQAKLSAPATFGEYQVAVLTTDEIVAWSVDGVPGQVVISTGLVAQLSQEELAAVLAHETAHLDHNHYRYLVLAGILRRALWFFPLVYSSIAALRGTLERWADEVAVGTEEGRRNSLRRALLHVVAEITGTGVAAFSEADSVIERLEALDAPPPRLNAASLSLLWAPGVALGLLSTAGFSVWLGDFRTLIEVASRCPI